MKRVIALLLLSGTVIIILFMQGNVQGKEKEQQQLFDYHMVSHAMGGIQNYAYTNSYESFIVNYEKGNRVFEVDLLLSEDNHLVARHEWSRNMTKLLGQESLLEADRHAVPITYEEFMGSKILDMYTPLDWDTVLHLMTYYPDVYIITDMKEQDDSALRHQFELLVETATSKNPELLDRIIPQIYNQEMLGMVRDVHDFSHIIYTLYASKDTENEVIDFVARENISIVTMPEHLVNADFVSKLKKAGARCYVHTINEPDVMDQYALMGIEGFYTDYLTEADYDSLSRFRFSRSLF